MAFVYILKSLKNDKHYIGSTQDVEKRFKTHQSGGVLSTRGLRPLELVFQQQYTDIDTARKIEKKLKKFKRRDYINKIVKDGSIKFS